MNPESTPANADQNKNTLEDAFAPLEDRAKSACGIICDETRHIANSANDCIRRNPIPSVVGAAVFGAAVCYLIMSGRHEPTFRERYLDGPFADAGDSLRDAGDSISSSLHSVFNHLKFW